jgi:hypothetical protein
MSVKREKIPMAMFLSNFGLTVPQSARHPMDPGSPVIVEPCAEHA